MREHDDGTGRDAPAGQASCGKPARAAGDDVKADPGEGVQRERPLASEAELPYGDRADTHAVQCLAESVLRMSLMTRAAEHHRSTSAHGQERMRAATVEFV